MDPGMLNDLSDSRSVKSSTDKELDGRFMDFCCGFGNRFDVRWRGLLLSLVNDRSFLGGGL
jgi:hypothetical protein